METKLKNQFTIKNCVLPQAQMITLLLSIEGGSCEEKLSQKGITHLVEHLCFRRVAGINQADFYYGYEKLGATLQAVTHNTHVLFELTVNPKYILDAAKILRSLYEENKWTHEDIRKEKQVVIKQIEDKYYLFDSFKSLILAGSLACQPISGTVAKVNRLTYEKLIKWKSKLFTANRSQLTISGNVSDEELTVISQLFADIKNNCDNKVDILKPSYFLKRNAACATFTQAASTHINVIVGFDIDFDKTCIAEVQLFESMLAKGDYTPLKLCLREEMGVLHEIDSELLAFDFGGILYFNFRVLVNDSLPFIKALANILAAQKQCLDEKAFICAKAAFCVSNADLLTDSKALAYCVYNLKGIETPQKHISQYESISYSQMQKMAEQILRASNLFIYIDDVPSEENFKDLRQQIWDAKTCLTERLADK